MRAPWKHQDAHCADVRRPTSDRVAEMAGATRSANARILKRANLGLDRTPCGRCGHREDMHADRDGLRVCVVCSGIGRWPCSPQSLELERAERA